MKSYNETVEKSLYIRTYNLMIELLDKAWLQGNLEAFDDIDKVKSTLYFLYKKHPELGYPIVMDEHQA